MTIRVDLISDISFTLRHTKKRELTKFCVKMVLCLIFDLPLYYGQHNSTWYQWSVEPCCVQYRAVVRWKVEECLLILQSTILNISIIIHTRPYANHAINEKYSVINHQCKHIHYLGLKIKCSLMFKIEVFSLRKQKRVFSIKAAHLCTEVVQCSQRQAVPVVERILTCFSFFPSPQVLPCADAMDRCQNYAIS